MNEEQLGILNKDNIIMDNLSMLSDALKNAVDMRFMSHEHGKTIWKSYLKVSGMDIPKQISKTIVKIKKEK